MAAITAATGIRPIVTHTGTDTEMDITTLTMEAIIVIIITITTGLVRFITGTAEAFLQEEEQPPEILLMQEI